MNADILKKVQSMVALVVGILIGCTGAALYCRHVWSGIVEELLLEERKSHIVENANTLTLLRDKKYDALINVKEENLNRNLFALSLLQGPYRDNCYKVAARYRGRFPYLTGNTNIDQAVKELLMKVEYKRPTSQPSLEK